MVTLKYGTTGLKYYFEDTTYEYYTVDIYCFNWSVTTLFLHIMGYGKFKNFL